MNGVRGADAPGAGAVDGSAGRWAAGLSPARRRALEAALLARRPRRAPVGPRDRSQPAPLSPPQLRLWFMDQLDPGAPTYNAAVAFRARGPLDTTALTATLERTVARHEVLHSVVRGDPPTAHVLLDWVLEVRHEDLFGRAPDDRWEAAQEWARQFCRQPYDLARDLPLRLGIVRLAAQDHLVVVGEHHIAFDGWSDELLFAELSEGYAAATAGRPWEPAPPELHYADVAAYWAASPPVPGSERFWQQTLAGAPRHVELPVDRPHPAVPGHEGRHLPVAVPGVGPALAALGAARSATAYMVVSAAFAAALHRWSGVGDLVLGTPMAHRLRPEFEPVIGFFANTVPVRVALDGASTFADTVDRVRTADIEAMEHQSVPFERIVELTGGVRDPRRNPLFQVNVRVQHAGPPLPQLPGLTLEAVAVDLGFARFDLALDLCVRDGGLEGYLEYDVALFDEATARQFVGWLEAFVADAVARPDCPVADLRFGPARTPVRGRRRTASPR